MLTNLGVPLQNHSLILCLHFLKTVTWFWLYSLVFELLQITPMHTGCQHSESHRTITADHVEVWWQICFKNLCSLNSSIFYYCYWFRSVRTKVIPEASTLLMAQSKAILLHCTSFQCLPMDAKLFFNPMADFWQALKKISKVFLDSDLLVQFSISHLISLFHAFWALSYPGKSVGRAQVIGLGAFERVQLVKAPQNRFPYSQLGSITRREAFPKRQTLTSGWSLDVAPGRVRAASLLDCHEGSQSYRHLILASLWCPETWLGLQLHVQIKDVDLRRQK